MQHASQGGIVALGLHPQRFEKTDCNSLSKDITKADNVSPNLKVNYNSEATYLKLDYLA